MSQMWWRTEPGDLGRVEDRLSTVYLSHGQVDRQENAICLVRENGTVHVPTAMVATLLLGPGTTITHAAVNLLADSGTSVLWVGEQGVRLYAAGHATSRTSRLLLRQAWLVSSPKRRLSVARKMYDLRFEGEDTSRLTMQQLRGREGARVRASYLLHSERTGVPWTGRHYRAGDAYAAGDDVNRMLSAANASLYGVTHAAVTALGCSPGLGFVHTGHAQAFVHDIADLFKASVTVPLAFDTVAAGKTTEAAARHAVRDRIKETGLLPALVRAIYDLLLDEVQEVLPDPAEMADGGPLLWDDRTGTLPGGTAYGFVDPSMP
jgi:CRISPR-associated protein Cas1